MIFLFPLRGSGCCSYGVSIPADYKTRREKLFTKFLPSGFCFISLQSDGVDINHFAVFDLNIALEAARSSAETVSIEVRHGLHALPRYGGCTEPSSG